MLLGYLLDGKVWFPDEDSTRAFPFHYQLVDAATLGAGHENIISGNELWHPMRQGIGRAMVPGGPRKHFRGGRLKQIPRFLGVLSAWYINPSPISSIYRLLALLDLFGLFFSVRAVLLDLFGSFFTKQRKAVILRFCSICSIRLRCYYINTRSLICWLFGNLSLKITSKTIRASLADPSNRKPHFPVCRSQKTRFSSRKKRPPTRARIGARHNRIFARQCPGLFCAKP
jgi:hypothetical protein